MIRIFWKSIPLSLKAWQSNSLLQTKFGGKPCTDTSLAKISSLVFLFTKLCGVAWEKELLKRFVELADCVLLRHLVVSNFIEYLLLDAEASHLSTACTLYYSSPVFASCFICISFRRLIDTSVKIFTCKCFMHNFFKHCVKKCCKIYLKSQQFFAELKCAKHQLWRWRVTEVTHLSEPEVASMAPAVTSR